MNTALFAHHIDRHDVGMVKSGHRANFVLKSANLHFIDESGQRQHLEGDSPSHRNLFGLVDDSHATPANLAKDAKVTKLLVPFAGNIIGRCVKRFLGGLQRRDDRLQKVADF